MREALSVPLERPRCSSCTRRALGSVSQRRPRQPRHWTSWRSRQTLVPRSPPPPGADSAVSPGDGASRARARAGGAARGSRWGCDESSVAPRRSPRHPTLHFVLLQCRHLGFGCSRDPSRTAKKPPENRPAAGAPGGGDCLSLSCLPLFFLSFCLPLAPRFFFASLLPSSSSSPFRRLEGSRAD